MIHHTPMQAEAAAWQTPVAASVGGAVRWQTASPHQGDTKQYIARPDAWVGDSGELCADTYSQSTASEALARCCDLIPWAGALPTVTASPRLPVQHEQAFLRRRPTSWLLSPLPNARPRLGSTLVRVCCECPGPSRRHVARQSRPYHESACPRERGNRNALRRVVLP